MRSSSIWALAPFLGLTSAFKDTSPFILVSTSELLIPTQLDLVSASTIRQAVIPQLETCPSDTYVIVSQPGVHAADYSDKHTAPFLRQMVKGENTSIRSSVAIQDVLGDVNAEQLGHVARTKCGAGFLRVDASTGSFEIADDMRPRVITLDFPALPTAKAERLLKLAENDAFLSSVLDLLPSPKFTLIYTTTPSTTRSAHQAGSEPDYQMDSLFQSPIHMDLKRDFTAGKRDSEEKLVLVDGPLFERYAFLSPGLFMGILVSLLLLGILYVGIGGVASLQVTYAAFDKEMGPAAQKKAQ